MHFHFIMNSFSLLISGKKFLRKLSRSESALNSGSSHLQAFSFSTIKAATNNFSRENQLGEGGFGPVYKVTYDLFSLDK